jgi:hypothetical protein
MSDTLKAQKLPEADYPKEIWFAALNAYREIGLRSDGSTSDRVNAIADAILAERYRSARNEGLLTEALRLHQMIFDSFRGYIPDFEEAVVEILRKAREV